MRTSHPRRVTWFFVVLALLPATALAEEGPGPSGRLIMALQQEHRVAAYSPRGELLASAPTGLRPRALAKVGSDRILVTNRGADASPGSSLTLLSADSLQPLETIAACSGCGPAGLLVDGSGKVYLGAQRHKAIQVFDAPGGNALRTLLTPWGWPGEIVTLPWGEGIAIGFNDSTQIGVLELSAKRIGSLEIEVDPTELAPRPGHEELWVGTRMGRVAIVVPDGEAAGRVAEMLIVERPLDLAFEPNGKRLFGASAATPNIWYLDADTREPAGSIPLEAANAHLLAFSPDGRYLAVALYQELRCLVYDVGVEGEPQLLESFTLTSRPRDMIWLP